MRPITSTIKARTRDGRLALRFPPSFEPLRFAFSGRSSFAIMQRPNLFRSESITLKPGAGSEKVLLREKCLWYMRKYDEACERVKSIESDKETSEVEWRSRWEKSQAELARLLQKCDQLAKDNERLLSVIASLKKPVKRKPLPPKKVFPDWSRFDLGMWGMYRRKIV